MATYTALTTLDGEAAAQALAGAVEILIEDPAAARSMGRAGERRARRLPSVAPHGAWIHGSSVGEARIVRSLAESLRELRPTLPLSVSAYTPTGRQQLPGAPLADADAESFGTASQA